MECLFQKSNLVTLWPLHILESKDFVQEAPVSLSHCTEQRAARSIS